MRRKETLYWSCHCAADIWNDTPMLRQLCWPSLYSQEESGEVSMEWQRGRRPATAYPGLLIASSHSVKKIDLMRMPR